jgi:hypothetical protein
MDAADLVENVDEVLVYEVREGPEAVEGNGGYRLRPGGRTGGYFAPVYSANQRAASLA